MARSPKTPSALDTELEAMTPDARWREWMNRVEAVLFASAEPVGREMLSRVVGRDCDLDLVIDDIRAELLARPFDVVSVAGGFQYRTKPGYAQVVRASGAPVAMPDEVSQQEALVLMMIGYFQPVTRSELSRIYGREVSRDTIAGIRRAGFITFGPRSPTPGSPYTYVTTETFLSAFGFTSLRDLPDLERLEDAGLLSRRQMNPDALSAVLGIEEDEAD
ncbi:SMC-Scp complex subunit ScpB [Rhizobium sp. 0TCS1.26]|uniref:SMC-Scp complex subunit ScpB n=1 Tax=Rhizobium sp. 0TCS1.26 TaxID=3142623 RepID=UPI003D2A2BB6